MTTNDPDMSPSAPTGGPTASKSTGHLGNEHPGEEPEPVSQPSSRAAATAGQIVTKRPPGVNAGEAVGADDANTFARADGADTPLPEAGAEAAELLLGTDVVALGMRITAELGGNDVPLLARWMALRIAELIQKMEAAADATAREDAARACADLVLRVWEARSNWPQGWPPESAAQVVASLEERAPWQRAILPEREEDLSWLTTLPAAFDSLEEEKDLWRLIALADTDPSDIRAWFEQPGAPFGQAEKRQLESITDAAERASERLVRRLAPPDLRRGRRRSDGEMPMIEAERGKLTIRRMRQLARARLRLAERVAAAAKAQLAASAQGGSEDSITNGKE